MSSEIRLSRVNKALREILSFELVKLNGFLEDSVLTLTHVESSKDIRYAKVFISVYGKEEPHEVLDILNEHRKSFQKTVSKKLPVKFCPVLRFILAHG